MCAKKLKRKSGGFKQRRLQSCATQVPLTIQVEFVDAEGRLCYKCCTWAGYLGVLTAMVPQVLCVAVNFRESPQGGLWAEDSPGTRGFKGVSVYALGAVC
jgi:hypothetical protein